MLAIEKLASGDYGPEDSFSHLTNAVKKANRTEDIYAMYLGGHFKVKERSDSGERYFNVNYSRSEISFKISSPNASHSYSKAAEPKTCCPSIHPSIHPFDGTASTRYSDY